MCCVGRSWPSDKRAKCSSDSPPLSYNRNCVHIGCTHRLEAKGLPLEADPGRTAPTYKGKLLEISMGSFWQSQKGMTSTIFLTELPGTSLGHLCGNETEGLRGRRISHFVATSMELLGSIFSLGSRLWGGGGGASTMRGRVLGVRGRQGRNGRCFLVVECCYKYCINKANE